MKILSVFDGMACGAIAFTELNIPIEKYVAFEIDKYAIKVATHNFPFIDERGDVFEADFTEFKGYDWLIGGSPCTHWSIAQKNHREVLPEGIGWELFSQYVRALKEAEPKYFLYENNKSMSKAIRQSITETFGFEPICINSALVSAQNRQRLYWVGIRQSDGTYKKANIEQPEDRGILLKDILENGMAEKDKGYCLKHQAENARDYFKKHHTNIKFEPVRIPTYGDDTKSRPVEALYAKHAGTGEGSLEKRLCSDNPNKQQNDLIAEPIKVGALHKLYAIPVEFDGDIPTKAISLADGKEHDVYIVKDGQITIKGKQYPIKLINGYYIIRKLTVTECMRLQTVPEWYQFKDVISDSQAYKCLGNGWTVQVIMHLINSALKDSNGSSPV